MCVLWRCGWGRCVDTIQSVPTYNSRSVPTSSQRILVTIRVYSVGGGSIVLQPGTREITHRDVRTVYMPMQPLAHVNLINLLTLAALLCQRCYQTTAPHPNSWVTCACTAQASTCLDVPGRSAHLQEKVSTSTGFRVYGCEKRGWRRPLGRYIHNRL